jgi:hypothetical protein
MKKMIVLLLICIFLSGLAMVGYSRVYITDINNLYNLKYGVKTVPVIKELWLVEKRDYFSARELVIKRKDLLMAYLPPKPGDKIKPLDMFLIVDYTLLF